jgi:cardiolipin synthase
MLTLLPNVLSLSRIAAIPVLVILMYLEAPLWAWIACVLFTIAGLTDVLDGWLARRSKTTSKLGQFLDPIADKLLVAAVLLMLVAEGRISEYSLPAALVILCREFLVSGLREFLADLRVGVPVTRLAKWKTAIQMISLGWLIVAKAGPDLIPVQAIGETGLWIAALLTLVTGWDYLRAGLAHMDIESPPPSDGKP